MNDHCGMYPMFWNGMGAWMFLFCILIIVVIVGTVIFLTRKGNTDPENSALDILKVRYARGEISKQEFEERKRDIL